MPWQLLSSCFSPHVHLVSCEFCDRNLQDATNIFLYFFWRWLKCGFSKANLTEVNGQRAAFIQRYRSVSERYSKPESDLKSVLYYKICTLDNSRAKDLFLRVVNEPDQSHPSINGLTWNILSTRWRERTRLNSLSSSNDLFSEPGVSAQRHEPLHLHPDSAELHG